MRRWGAWWLAAGMSIGAAAAQTAKFQSASVKLVAPSPDEFHAVLGTAIQGEVRLTNATLAECLRFAYGVTNNFQVLGPDWMHSTEYRYNVLAKTAPETPLQTMRQMLQDLLVERFRIALHKEVRDMSFLAVTVSPRGVKMPKARAGSDASGNAQVPGRIVSNSMSMPQLTTLVARFLGQPVQDMTGLEGWYEIKLTWTPGADDAGIFQALEDQLGLKLERHNGPVEVLVVDRAEKKPLGD